MAAVAAMAAVSVIGGAVTANQAKKAAGRAADDASMARAGIAAVKAARIPITNPYADSKNLSELAKDLSSMISNPFANLGVATQAAEIQIEQSNIALSNALDTLATTGASAGGATALAQAALAAKKGVASTIEQQEAQNQRLEAQGKAQMQNQMVSEQQRLQGIEISEGQRMQTQEASGKQFMMQMNEQRSNADLDYNAGKESQAMANAAAANAAKGQAWGSAISGVAGAFGTPGAFDSAPTPEVK